MGDKSGRAATVRLKIVTTGSTGAGKSCLIKNYCEGRFVKRYLPTIGVDYGVRALEIDNVLVRINFFDLSGMDEYADIRREFYGDLQALMVVVDATSKTSIAEGQRLVDEAVAHGAKLDGANAAVFVFLTKTDMDAAVSDAEVNAFAAKLRAKVFRVSSATSEGVADSFNTVFRAAFELATRASK